MAGGAALAASALLALPAAPAQAGPGNCGSVTGISPASGGTVVTITGSGFATSFCAPAGQVNLSSGGTVVADIFSISNLTDTSFTVTMPAEPAGTYDVTVAGSAQVSFAVTCVSGATPSASSFTVPIAAQTYPVTGSAWIPSGDQSSPLVYQGSTTVPDLCGGGQLDLAKGGTFTATLS